MKDEGNNIFVLPFRTRVPDEDAIDASRRV